MKKRSQWFSWIGSLAILLSLLAGIPSLAQSATAQTPTAESEATEEFAGTLSDRACPNIGPSGEREGDTYYCGLMTVPENYAEPNGRQIQISYAVLKSTSQSPLTDPMIYLDGGPGGSSLQNIAGRARMWEQVREHRDVIIFDQRGTKYSTRLNCNPSLYGFNYLLETDEEFQDLLEEIESLTDADTMPSTVLQIIYTACSEALEEAGYDLSQYNSANSVKDIFALTNALGYNEVNLVGISYGTRLALTAMRDHPQQIRSVVIDSVYPLEVNGIEWFPMQADESINRIVERCENDRDCNRHYPNFRENLLALSESLAESNPDGLAGLFSLFNLANQLPQVAEYLPIIVEEIVAGGDTPVLTAVIDGDLPTEEAPEDLPGEWDDMLIEAQDLQDTAEAVFLRAAMQEQANRPGAVWMKNIGEAMAPLSREESGYAALALLSILIYYPEPDVEILRGFVTEFLPEENQEELLSELDQLSPSEIQYVYDLINDLSDEVSDNGGGFTDGMYYAVECYEEAPFNNLQVAIDSVDDLNFPALSGLRLSSSEEIATVCSVWPESDADPIETQPVVSDIPTLVIVGDWDTQTPASWGAPLLEHLSNATLVEAPSSGHGVIFYSDCAYDLFLSFLYSPESELNQRCLRGLEPNFVSPSMARAQLAALNGDADQDTNDEPADEETTDDPDAGDDTQPDEDGDDSGGGGGGEERPIGGRLLLP